MDNKEISRIFFEMSVLCEMHGERFKARAYERAARLIENLLEEIGDTYASDGEKGILNLPGVGKNTARHLQDLLRTGTFEEYVRLKKKIPVDVVGLLAIESVGPHNIRTLWEKLGIRTVDELEKAAKDGLIADLEYFGTESQRKILEGIRFLKKSSGRRPLGTALEEARRLESAIGNIEGVKKIAISGSLRRKKEDIGDIDILVVSDDPAGTMEEFAEFAQVDKILVKGTTKVSATLKGGIAVDLRIVERDSFGAALQYFTGSKAHNIKLRHIAKEAGYKLNEYGLFDGRKKVAGSSERKIYEKLGLAFIEPELREDRGEVEEARVRKLPKLIGYTDLRGDLQIQSDWSDGKVSIKEMAEGAMKMGLEYIAVTDHSKGLVVANGLDEKRLARQGFEIDQLNKEFASNGKAFKILKGVEVDIRKDGSLDLADEALAELDVVGASIHSSFDLSRKQQTERLVRAMNNPHVDIIFHLTTRIVGKRKPIAVDLEAVLDAAKATGTVMEIDAFLDRLDINDIVVRRCIDKRIKLSIDSDAHMVKHLAYLEYGIAQARRGWAEKRDVINTYPVGRMLKFLKHGKAGQH